VSNPQTIAERYVALWNEADPGKRRQAIAAFFAPGAAHYVKQREAVGSDALFDRVTGSHEKNVRDNGSIFRAAPGAQLLRDVVIFDWEMTPAGDPKTVSAVGREIVTLDGQGRAVSDYQFIVG
jgi:hypothetical protein